MTRITRVNKTVRRLVASSAMALAALGVGGNANKADAAIVSQEPFTSFGQLYVRGPPASPGQKLISNAPNYDFFVDGEKTSKMASLGLLKDGQIIGYANNDWETYGDGLYGFVNVDSGSASNAYALVVGDRANGLFGGVDVNEDGKFGDLFYHDINGDGVADTLEVAVQDGEVIFDEQGFLLNNIRGDFSSMPVYNGAGTYLDSLPQIELDTSYAVPEPSTLGLITLAFGWAGWARRRGAS